jgi:RNA polymerase sigma-70 factor (ECF subfamily)
MSLSAEPEVCERARLARAAWPDIALPAQEFAVVLASDSRSDERYDADRYLAYACARGAAGAVPAFERTQLQEVPRFVHKLRLTPELLDELRQLLREKLFVGPTPKIANYRGTGPLGAWLRVAAIRAAVDLLRRRTVASSEPPDWIDECPRPDAWHHDVELDYLGTHYRPLIHEAFRQALLTLSCRERNLLRLHLVDGLTFDQLGQLFHAARSSTFRHVQAAKRKLLAEARRHVREHAGVSAGDFDSLVRAVHTRIDWSLF